MVKRLILMLVVMALFIAGLGFLKFRQFQAMAGQAFTPPPEAVTTIVAKQENWPATLSQIGTMAAVQGVTVSADLPGIVDRIAFDSGKWVQQGDVLVRLDTRQEEAQLAAVEANRDLARLNFTRMQGLVNEGAISRAEYDQAAAEQKATEARVGEIRATIARKTIRAPFSGILGIRQVNLGQYLAGGDPVVGLQSLQPDLRELRRPAAAGLTAAAGSRGARDGCRPRWRAVHRKDHGCRIGCRRNDAKHANPGDSGESARRASARHVRSDGGHAGREPLGRGAAGLRH